MRISTKGDSMASKPKDTDGGEYTTRDTKWYREMAIKINETIEDAKTGYEQMSRDIKEWGEGMRHETNPLAAKYGVKPNYKTSYSDITERIGHPKLLNEEEYIEHMNSILILAQVARNDGKEVAEEAIPILSEYANGALTGAKRLGLYKIMEDFARDFRQNGLYIK